MPEGFINLTEGAGKKAHTFQRTIGANTVEDTVSLIGLPYLAAYSAIPGALSVATAASHLIQIMAGASLNVYVYRVRIWQLAAATAAAIDEYRLVRLTTAGTGGGGNTPAPHDPADAASGATAMTLPTAKGTEGTIVARQTAQFTQTIATQSGGGLATLLCDFDYDVSHGKPIKIAAGVANGLAVYNVTARAAGTVIVQVDFLEANF